MSTVENILRREGPARAARLAKLLQDSNGLGAAAARKRISRVRPPIRRYPLPLLPKREAFLYLEEDRNGQRFWDNLVNDLRDSAGMRSDVVVEVCLLPVSGLKHVVSQRVCSSEGPLELDG